MSLDDKIKVVCGLYKVVPLGLVQGRQAFLKLTGCQTLCLHIGCGVGWGWGIAIAVLRLGSWSHEWILRLVGKISLTGHPSRKVRQSLTLISGRGWLESGPRLPNLSTSHTRRHW